MADNTCNCGVITILLYFLDTFSYYAVPTSNINWGHLEMFCFYFSETVFYFSKWSNWECHLDMRKLKPSSTRWLAFLRNNFWKISCFVIGFIAGPCLAQKPDLLQARGNSAADSLWTWVATAALPASPACQPTLQILDLPVSVTTWTSSHLHELEVEWWCRVGQDRSAGEWC